MLRTTGPPAKPDIQRAIEGLIKEDSNFDRLENRSAHRDSLVLPISIQMRESQETLSAFSRNVSATGIGVITQDPIDDKSVASLKIAKLDGEVLTVLAECRWSKPYGKSWYLSGWQFISLQRLS